LYFDNFFYDKCTCYRKNWQSCAYRRANKTCHIKTCHRKLACLAVTGFKKTRLTAEMGCQKIWCLHRKYSQKRRSFILFLFQAQEASASFSCLIKLISTFIVKIQNYFLCMCWRRMFCFSDHSPWETNLKSIPFN
jgi:hypothetical protein